MVVVSELILCPICQHSEAVVRHGTNRGGTLRLRCKTCAKTFTPRPNPRRTSAEREAQVLAAEPERLSIVAVARLLGMSRQTVYDVLKKSRQEQQDGTTG